MGLWKERLVLLATEAFGKGVHVPDIEPFVIHLGPPSDVISLWQQIGHCAGGDSKGHASLYILPKKMDKCADDVILYYCLDPSCSLFK